MGLMWPQQVRFWLLCPNYATNSDVDVDEIDDDVKECDDFNKGSQEENSVMICTEAPGIANVNAAGNEDSRDDDEEQEEEDLTKKELNEIKKRMEDMQLLLE
eukprot:CAMPEP_0195513946 /NCGR_PEP_ID=MMETSP0794_2-20130614/5488_1 /TAXON_ID=515487 /ORGANISM="Stephanopyxis turris, Strain CCMP 815" /LENGTH=101 /DNA_ID=CAMNT_0040642083 /DNA_START=139 /DNA_END=441 /DNA_ORIENTATION=+